MVGCEASIIQQSIVRTLIDTVGKPDFFTLKSVNSLLYQRLNFSVSRPNLLHSLAWDVPFIVPVMTRAALY